MSANRNQPVAFETLESSALFSVASVGYLPDWEYSSTLISKMDWSALTQVNYFSTTANSSTGKINTTSTDEFHVSRLDSTVAAAHAHGVKVSLVIGGAGLDSYFPTIAASGTKRTAFASSIKSFASAHHLNGVDLDWEPLNPTNTQVTNYGLLIHQLRVTNPNLKLSAAVNPEKLPNGQDYSHPRYVLNTQAIKDLNQIGVMAYDLDYAYHSSWTRSTQDLNGWATYLSNNGVSKTKLLFGLPFYGRAGTSWSNSAAVGYGDIIDRYKAQHGGVGPSTSADNLAVSFPDQFGGQTVQWYFNGKNTITAKTNYAIDHGAGGVMIWDLGQDHFTSTGNYDSYSLLPAVKAAIKAHTTSATSTTRVAVTQSMFSQEQISLDESKDDLVAIV
jgi:chitinase